MIALGLDTETTGFLDTGDHRFVEVYAGLWDDTTGAQIDAFYKRIHPGRSIPSPASNVHGILLSDLAGCPPFEEIAGELQAFMARGDYMVAHNGISFDGPFLDQEFMRVGLPAHRMRIIDTCTDARWATHNGKNPTLGELCFAMGVPYDASAAHAASYDVEVMMQCFFTGRRWNYFQDTETSLAA